MYNNLNPDQNYITTPAEAGKWAGTRLGKRLFKDDRKFLSLCPWPSDYCTSSPLGEDVVSYFSGNLELLLFRQIFGESISADISRLLCFGNGLFVALVHFSWIGFLMQIADRHEGLGRVLNSEKKFAWFFMIELHGWHKLSLWPGEWILHNYLQNHISSSFQPWLLQLCNIPHQSIVNMP